MVSFPVYLFSSHSFSGLVAARSSKHCSTMHSASYHFFLFSLHTKLYETCSKKPACRMPKLTFSLLCFDSFVMCFLVQHVQADLFFVLLLLCNSLNIMLTCAACLGWWPPCCPSVWPTPQTQHTAPHIHSICTCSHNVSPAIRQSSMHGHQCVHKQILGRDSYFPSRSSLLLCTAVQVRGQAAQKAGLRCTARQ